MPTLTTLPLILLVIFLWRSTKGRILSIVMFTSIFDAASALNFGVMGVAPWLFTLVVCLTVAILKGRPLFHLQTRFNKVAFNLIILFLVYAVFTGLVYPFLFQGISVSRATTGPLEWTFSNLSQIFYLIAASIVYLLALSASREELQSAVDWYIRGCIVAGLFALYQLANAIVHVPYPDAVLYSNTAHVVYHAYKINGMWRLNSTFTEASEMAGFLTAGLGMLTWKMVKEPVRARSFFSFCLLLACVLMTISSTGYVCLIFMALIGVVFYGRYLVRQGALSRLKLIGAIVLVFGSVAYFAASESASASVGKVITSVLLDKRNSESYRERSASHDAAMKTLADSYYMGAGWGSIRSSGLVYMLLGTVGIAGFLVFCAFYASLYLPLFSRNQRLVLPARRKLFGQALFGTAILLCGYVIAGSEPTIPILWVLFGVATAGLPMERGWNHEANTSPSCIEEAHPQSTLIAP